MAKTRVSELAKQYGVKSADVLKMLGDIGEFAKTASSSIEPPAVKKFEDKYGAELKAKMAPAEDAPADKAPAKKAPAKKAAAPAEEPAAAAPAETEAAPAAPAGPRPGPRPAAAAAKAEAPA
ncbi:translation initiation factor IF-2 N-terminal domain-containing protein, partial [Nocardioides panacisoli]|uniref:translation initiation factor IF-2 N-terminal domain-containing protein n=1 Tax=Nocardioides panacisoli TaxID=627624 RepID=UPI0031E4446E